MKPFGFVWGDVFNVQKIFPNARFFAYGFCVGHYGICLVRLETNYVKDGSKVKKSSATKKGEKP